MKTLLVIAIFIVSLSVYAEEDPGDNGEGRTPQEEIKVLEEDITELEEEITDLEEENTGLEEEITDLEKENTGLEVENTNLEEEITGLEKELQAARRQGEFKNVESFIGDKISYPFDIPASEIEIFNNKSVKPACIPAGLQLRVLTEPDDDGFVLAVVLSGPYDYECGRARPQTDKAGAEQSTTQETALILRDNSSKVAPENLETKNRIRFPNHPLANILIKINSRFAGASPKRSGWTYGTLLVPYKGITSGSKTIKSSATIGPYFGRRIEGNTGLEFKFIGFFGPSAIENSTEENGESKTDTLFGLSYGLGLLITVKQEFQMGIVVGEDRVGEDSDFEDNGKTWLAIALGYEFE